MKTMEEVIIECRDSDDYDNAGSKPRDTAKVLADYIRREFCAEPHDWHITEPHTCCNCGAKRGNDDQ